MYIQSVILEKEREVTTDPRGVVLTGDALRSLWKLGLGKRMSWIGQGDIFLYPGSAVAICHRGELEG